MEEYNKAADFESDENGSIVEPTTYEQSSQQQYLDDSSWGPVSKNFFDNLSIYSNNCFHSLQNSLMSSLTSGSLVDAEGVDDNDADNSSNVNPNRDRNNQNIRRAFTTYSYNLLLALFSMSGVMFALYLSGWCGSSTWCEMPVTTTWNTSTAIRKVGHDVVVMKPNESYHLVNEVGTKPNDSYHLVNCSTTPSPPRYLFYQEDIVTMPDCAQRTTGQLYLHFGDLQLNSQPKDYAPHYIFGDLNLTGAHLPAVDSVIKKLRDQIQKQGLSSAIIQDHLDKAENLIKQKASPNNVYEEFLFIYNKLRPLHVPAVIRTKNALSSDLDALVGKIISLVRGLARGGKSLCMHGLGGSTIGDCKCMPETSNNTNVFVGPVMIELDSLKMIEVAPSLTSVTKRLHPVCINDNVYDKNKVDMCLVDSQGEDGSEGAEIELAQAIMRLLAVHQAEAGVRVIAMIILRRGSNKEDVTKQLESLIDFFGVESSIESWFSSILPLYNFLGAENDRSVLSELYEVQRAFCGSMLVCEDTPVGKLIELLIDKARSQAPFDYHPKDATQQQQILEELSNTPLLFKYPFSLSMSKTTWAAVESQTSIAMNDIKFAFQERDINLLFHNLNELLLLSNISDDKKSSLSNSYDHTLTSILDTMKDLFKRILVDFEDSFREVSVSHREAMVQSVALDYQFYAGVYFKLNNERVIARIESPNDIAEKMLAIVNNLIEKELKATRTSLCTGSQLVLADALLSLSQSSLQTIAAFNVIYDNFMTSLVNNFDAKGVEGFPIDVKLIPSAEKWRQIATITTKMDTCLSKRAVFHRHHNDVATSVRDSFNRRIQSYLKSVARNAVMIYNKHICEHMNDETCSPSLDDIASLNYKSLSDVDGNNAVALVSIIRSANDASVYGAKDLFDGLLSHLTERVLKLFSYLQTNLHLRSCDNCSGFNRYHDIVQIRKIPDIQSKTVFSFESFTEYFVAPVSMTDEEDDDDFFDFDFDARKAWLANVKIFAIKLKKQKCFQNCALNNFQVTSAQREFEASLSNRVQEWALEIDYLTPLVVKVNELAIVLQSCRLFNQWFNGTLENVYNASQEALSRFESTVMTTLGEIAQSYNLSMVQNTAELQVELNRLEVIINEMSRYHPSVMFLRSFNNCSDVEDLIVIKDDIVLKHEQFLLMSAQNMSILVQKLNTLQLQLSSPSPSSSSTSDSLLLLGNLTMITTEKDTLEKVIKLELIDFHASLLNIDYVNQTYFELLHNSTIGESEDELTFLVNNGFGSFQEVISLHAKAHEAIMRPENIIGRDYIFTSKMCHKKTEKWLVYVKNVQELSSKRLIPIEIDSHAKTASFLLHEYIKAYYESVYQDMLYFLTLAIQQNQVDTAIENVIAKVNELQVSKSSAAIISSLEENQVELYLQEFVSQSTAYLQSLQLSDAFSIASDAVINISEALVVLGKLRPWQVLDSLVGLFAKSVVSFTAVYQDFNTRVQKFVQNKASQLLLACRNGDFADLNRFMIDLDSIEQSNDFQDCVNLYLPSIVTQSMSNALSSFRIFDSTKLETEMKREAVKKTFEEGINNLQQVLSISLYPNVSSSLSKYQPSLKARIDGFEVEAITKINNTTSLLLSWYNEFLQENSIELAYGIKLTMLDIAGVLEVKFADSNNTLVALLVDDLLSKVKTSWNDTVVKIRKSFNDTDRLRCDASEKRILIEYAGCDPQTYKGLVELLKDRFDTMTEKVNECEMLKIFQGLKNAANRCLPSDIADEVKASIQEVSDRSIAMSKQADTTIEALVKNIEARTKDEEALVQSLANHLKSGTECLNVAPVSKLRDGYVTTAKNLLENGAVVESLTYFMRLLRFETHNISSGSFHNIADLHHLYVESLKSSASLLQAFSQATINRPATFNEENINTAVVTVSYLTCFDYCEDRALFPSHCATLFPKSIPLAFRVSQELFLVNRSTTQMDDYLAILQAVAKKITGNSESFERAIQDPTKQVNSIRSSIREAGTWRNVHGNMSRMHLLPSEPPLLLINDMMTKLSLSLTALNSDLTIAFNDSLHDDDPIEQMEFFTQVYRNVTTIVELSDILSQDDRYLATSAKEVISNMKTKIVDAVSLTVKQLEKAKEGLPKKESCSNLSKLYSYAQALRNCLAKLESTLGNTSTRQQTELITKLTSIEDSVQIVAKELGRNVIVNPSGLDLDACSQQFIVLKQFSVNLPVLRKDIELIIDDRLRDFRELNGEHELQSLGKIFLKTKIGSRFLDENIAFANMELLAFLQNTREQDSIKYVLDAMNLPTKNAKYLSERLFEFNATFSKHHSCSTNITDRHKLIKEIMTATKMSTTNNLSGLPQDYAKTLGLISALWSCLTTEKLVHELKLGDNHPVFLKPLASQQMAMMSLMGFDFNLDPDLQPMQSLPTIASQAFSSASSFVGLKSKITKLTNGVTQVHTGGGKSMIIAVVAVFFALMGFHIDILTFSEHLRDKDVEEFKDFFDQLGVQDNIKYMTFRTAMETMLNQHGDLRSRTEDMVLDNHGSSNSHRSSPTAMIPIEMRICYVDESDTLQNVQYYGELYSAQVLLKTTSSTQLFKDIWSMKVQNNLAPTIEQVQKLASYIDIGVDEKWKQLIENETKKALKVLENYIEEVLMFNDDGRIVYVIEDKVTDAVYKGYQTSWDYHRAADDVASPVTEDVLDESVGFLLSLGDYSYTEIIRTQYAYIAGVTGTWEALAPADKQIARDTFNITRVTVMPNIFASQQEFKPHQDFKLMEDPAGYNEALFEEIKWAVLNKPKDKQRAVVIFFEDQKQLQDFYQQPFLDEYRDEINVITESLPKEVRNARIAHSTDTGVITLSVKVFSRGTDFKNKSKLVDNGGLHVVQAFMPRDNAQLVQVMGRQGRMGKKGSFRLIVLNQDLLWLVGEDWQTICSSLLELGQKEAYTQLFAMMEEKNNQECIAKDEFKENKMAAHQRSMVLYDALTTGNVETARPLLLSFNHDAKAFRVIIAIDNTGSMGKVLNTVGKEMHNFLIRTEQTLTSMGLVGDNFEIQIVLFNDYDCPIEELLEMSEFESDPKKLVDNMVPKISKVSPCWAGDTEEAVEAVLVHTLRVCEGRTNGSCQLMLLTDAGTKTRQSLVSTRAKKFTEEYWWKALGPPATVQDLFKDLVKQEVKVNTFYLRETAKENMQEIADATGGLNQELNLREGEESHPEVLDKIVEGILRQIGGERAVATYYSKFCTLRSKSSKKEE